MFEDSTNEIRKKISVATEDNFRETLKEILEVHEQALDDARGTVYSSEERAKKEKEANNSFRVMMLSPAVIQQGLTLSTHEDLILNENYVTERTKTWKDADDDIVIVFLRILECHIKMYASLLSQTKTKAEIKDILQKRKDRDFNKAKENIYKSSKLGKAKAKAVKGIRKAMPHLSFAAAEKLVNDMAVKK